MEPSPEGSIFGRDRRRARRHHVHTPAYASLSGSAHAAVVDLSEIINISDCGVCIQASSQMKINRLLPLCLDLSATSSRLHVVGHVIWSEPSGKTGIRFSEISDASRAEFDRWLDANEHAETAAHEAVPQSPAHHAAATKPTASRAYTTLVNEWAEMEKEVDSCGPDLDPALHLIAQRALTLTWASGTAIALINKLNPSEMVCRARAGTDSPEIGSCLEAGAGFSGECVRTGIAISCDDTEYDSRVDRKNCRALGIRSIVACPVKRNNEVIGIIEVFSPEPAAFWANDITVLQRLTTFVTRAVQRAEHARAGVLAFPLEEEPALSPSQKENQAESPESLAIEGDTTLRRRIIFLVAAVAVVMALIWFLLPKIANFGSPGSSLNASYSAEADSSPEEYSGMKFIDLTKAADQGNAGAEYALAMRYATGEGIKQDYHEALQLFIRAADHGSVRAQARVASWFWAGRGAPQDYSKAYYWALLAQAGGDESGSAIVQQTAPYLSPAQIAAEHKEAENWLHSHHIGKAE
jgi:TPR repeat protein